MLDWDKLKDDLRPIPDFEDLSRRWREAFAYAFVQDHYNLAMPELAGYTRRLLGEDSRHRYDAWAGTLVHLFDRLDGAGVKDLRDLVEQVDTREKFEAFTVRSGLAPGDLIQVLKYLVYWFIPMKKPLQALDKDDVRLQAPGILATIARLRRAGRADHGGACGGLSQHGGLHLHPQYGRLDDRRLRRRRAAPALPAQALLDGALRQLLPDRARRRLRCRGAGDSRRAAGRPLHRERQ